MQLSFLTRGMESLIPSILMIIAAGAIVSSGFLFEAKKSKEMFAIFEKEIVGGKTTIATNL